METTSYMAVSANFSSSYMYLLLESNKQELSEFTSAYVSMPIVLFIGISCILFFVIRKQKFKRLIKHQSILGVLGVLSIIVFLKLTGLIESNAYHNIVRGTYGYFDLQNSVKFNTDIKKDDINIKSDNEVLVVVIGESTTTRHMQLYGYHRETTPYLSSIKDSLLVYNNVVSSDIMTTKAVPKILTSLNYTKNNTIETNLIEVFNSSNYKTYWLSNQRPIGYHDNIVSQIASLSSYFKFFNHDNEVKTIIHDEILLPEFKLILNQKGKKVVFIRLIGTHFDYINRYPDSYNTFDTILDVSKKEKIINQYDNAILYNDFIVYKFIKDLQKQNSKSALLYLSDHGENVYDDADFFGRSEEALTKSMFEIPFLLWTSDSFEFPEDFDYQPNRAFMADHTYESIGHVFGVMHKSMDANRSIFSNSFEPRKRNVINDIDFDNYFLDNNK
ncbi:phosphoethanolamine transferase [Algibacter pectinivorans]|uniref:phosphoethanolamine transferase n=1 Tax=Algibacter pectinivorans TaxID=870482 RepID=UPI0015874B52|nr:phosphoethanolamine transferase [Algibacter pectinivorans]